MTAILEHGFLVGYFETQCSFGCVASNPFLNLFTGVTIKGTVFHTVNINLESPGGTFGGAQGFIFTNKNA